MSGAGSVCQEPCGGKRRARARARECQRELVRGVPTRATGAQPADRHRVAAGRDAAVGEALRRRPQRQRQRAVDEQADAGKRPAVERIPPRQVNGIAIGNAQETDRGRGRVGNARPDPHLVARPTPNPAGDGMDANVIPAGRRRELEQRDAASREAGHDVTRVQTTLEHVAVRRRAGRRRPAKPHGVADRGLDSQIARRRPPLRALRQRRRQSPRSPRGSCAGPARG